MRIPANVSWLVLFYRHKKLFKTISELLVGTNDERSLNRSLAEILKRENIVVSGSIRGRRNGVHGVCFVTLPVLKTPRIWVSCGNLGSVGNLYSPQRFFSRSLFRAFVVFCKTSFAERMLPGFEIDCDRKHLDLLRLIEEKTGDPRAVVSISSGRNSSERKITVQCTASSGEPMGFLKIADDAATTKSLKNEHLNLKLLDGNSPRVSPSPMFFHRENGFSFLGVSPLSGKLPGTGFGHAQRQFLEHLADDHQVVFRKTAIYALIASSARVNRALWDLWKEFRSSHADLLLRGAFVHGDFTPWNTRLENGSLFAFDWEYGTEKGIAGIDGIHHILNCLFLVNKQDVPEVKLNLLRILRNEWGHTYWNRCCDSRLIDVLVQITLFYDIARGLAFGKDISQLNRAKQELLFMMSRDAKA